MNTVGLPRAGGSPMLLASGLRSELSAIPAVHLVRPWLYPDQSPLMLEQHRRPRAGDAATVVFTWAVLPGREGGFALWRLLTSIGVACDVIAPSLVSVRAGDRVKTDRRDAKKLVTLFWAGLLRFVQPPTPETEGLRDLLRCRDDIRCARTAARHRVAKQLLRHGRIFRDGKKAWTLTHRAWVNRQQLDDPLAHEALSQMLTHLDSLDRQLAALDAHLRTSRARTGGRGRSTNSVRSVGSRR